jgi:hypothetical protein
MSIQRKQHDEKEEKGKNESRKNKNKKRFYSKEDSSSSSDVEEGYESDAIKMKNLSWHLSIRV